MTMNEFLLSIKDLVVNYGSIQALKGVNLDVKKGEIITLVGSNCAGNECNYGNCTNQKRKYFLSWE